MQVQKLHVDVGIQGVAVNFSGNSQVGHLHVTSYDRLIPSQHGSHPQDHSTLLTCHDSNGNMRNHTYLSVHLGIKYSLLSLHTF